VRSHLKFYRCHFTATALSFLHEEACPLVGKLESLSVVQCVEGQWEGTLSFVQVGVKCHKLPVASIFRKLKVPLGVSADMALPPPTGVRCPTLLVFHLELTPQLVQPLA
jgi:hypothetical protein